MMVLLRITPPSLQSRGFYSRDVFAHGSRSVAPWTLRRSTTVPANLYQRRWQLHLLPNALRLNQTVISGGQPRGDKGFEALEETRRPNGDQRGWRDAAAGAGAKLVCATSICRTVMTESRSRVCVSWQRPSPSCRARSISIAITANIAVRRRRRWPASARA